MHHVRHRVREDKHHQTFLFVGADGELRISAPRRSVWHARTCYCGGVESASAEIVETNVNPPTSATTWHVVEWCRCEEWHRSRIATGPLS
jgi:hypothetical protein